MPGKNTRGSTLAAQRGHDKKLSWDSARSGRGKSRHIKKGGAQGKREVVGFAKKGSPDSPSELGGGTRKNGGEGGKGYGETKQEGHSYLTLVFNRRESQEKE